MIQLEPMRPLSYYLKRLKRQTKWQSSKCSLVSAALILVESLMNRPKSSNLINNLSYENSRAPIRHGAINDFTKLMNDNFQLQLEEISLILPTAANHKYGRARCLIQRILSKWRVHCPLQLTQCILPKRRVQCHPHCSFMQSDLRSLRNIHVN